MVISRSAGSGTRRALLMGGRATVVCQGMFCNRLPTGLALRPSTTRLPQDPRAHAHARGQTRGQGQGGLCYRQRRSRPANMRPQCGRGAHCLADLMQELGLRPVQCRWAPGARRRLFMSRNARHTTRRQPTYAQKFSVSPSQFLQPFISPTGGCNVSRALICAPWHHGQRQE